MKQPKTTTSQASLCLALGIALALAACRGPATSPGSEASSPDIGTAAAETAAAETGFHATKTPYAPLQVPGEYEEPPQGFAPVFVQHVARHGSRAMTGPESADLALQVWRKARDEGALTPLGEAFGPVLEEVLAAHEALGYGNLSARGMKEHRDMATRASQRLPGYFERVAERSERIDIVSSGRDRAVDSGQNFADGLAAAQPALAGRIGPLRVDKDLLYFHKTELNADYQEYKENDPQLQAVLAEIGGQERTGQVARHLLERLYTPGFVDGLESGQYAFVDSHEGEDRIDNALDAAQVIYDIYLIEPGMSEEGDWGMGRFVEPADAEWLAYLDDAESFYEKGPGMAGRDITYRMSGVLLDDLFRKVEDRIAGADDVGGVFRFAHAETIIPLATLMGLPGSTEQAQPDRPFDYANNPWRGATVSPMGANVQWDVFGDGDRHLVRMLYNEAQTPFKADCQPIADGSYFYDFVELKRCFGRN